MRETKFSTRDGSPYRKANPAGSRQKCKSPKKKGKGQEKQSKGPNTLGNIAKSWNTRCHKVDVLARSEGKTQT